MADGTGAGGVAAVPNENRVSYTVPLILDGVALFWHWLYYGDE